MPILSDKIIKSTILKDLSQGIGSPPPDTPGMIPGEGPRVLEDGEWRILEDGTTVRVTEEDP